MTFFLASPAYADFHYGLVAYNRDDYETAFREFQKAAENGNLKAYNALGMMYLSGKGVYQDSTKGLDWYTRAAEKGHAASQFNLGQIYSAGYGGVKVDNNSALIWFIIAESNGNKFAKLNREFLTKKMTSPQIEKAQEMAKKWMAKHQN